MPLALKLTLDNSYNIFKGDKLMKRKVVFLSLGCILSCTAIAVSCIVVNNMKSVYKLKGTDDYYSITIDAADITTSTTQVVEGSFSVTTDQLHNPINLKFELATYDTSSGGIYLSSNEDGIIYNFIGENSEIRGMNSITIKGANDPFLVEWGYEVDSVVKYESKEWNYAGPDEGHIYDFGGDKPNYFRIKSGSGSGPSLLYQIIIKYGTDCQEGVNPYRTFDGIKYKKVNNDHFAVVGFSGSSFANVSLQSTIEGLPVNEICKEAFKDKPALASINLDNIEVVRPQAFEGCNNLTTVGSLLKMKSIGYNAFNTTAITGDLIFGDDLELIDDTAFYSVPMDTVTFSDDCVNPDIEDSAFRANSELTSMHIGSQFGSGFYCDFYNMPKLTTITIGAGNTMFEINGGALIKDEHLLMTFINNSSYTSWVMPNSVTDAFDYFAYGNSHLTSFTFNENITWITNNAFQNATALKTVVIGGNINIIGYNAFDGCAALDTVTFSSDIADDLTIRSDTFKNCTSLTSLTLPNRLYYLDAAFEGCSNLTTFTFDGTKDEWNSITKVSGWNSGLAATEVICSDGSLPLPIV